MLLLAFVASRGNELWKFLGKVFPRDACFFFFFFFLYADYICYFWFGILYERLKNEKKKNKEIKFEFENKKILLNFSYRIVGL